MIILIQNWFLSKDADRNKDFYHCLEMNIKNKHITKIIMLCEDNLNIDNKKITKIKSSRAKIKDCLIHANKEGINIIANLDIYFDETIKYINQISENECYALSRYDLINEELVPFHRRDSQDSWVFKYKKLNNSVGDYYLGLPGSDSRLCFELSKYYEITNPCKTIKSVHVHCNGSRWPEKRKYTEKERLIGAYRYVEPKHLLNKFPIL
jgi:hypothetical protein